MSNGSLASPLHTSRRLHHVWRRRHALSFRLTLCFLSIFLATISAKFFARDGSNVNLIWGANGLLLSYILLAPRWRWPVYLVVGVLAMAVGSKLIGAPWKTNLLYNVLNLTEVLAGALLLRRKSTQ